MFGEATCSVVQCHAVQVADAYDDLEEVARAVVISLCDKEGGEEGEGAPG